MDIEIITAVAKTMYKMENTLDIWDTSLSQNVRFVYMERAEQLLQAVNTAGYEVVRKNKIR